MTTAHIVYATARLADCGPGDRIPHRRQSEGAAQLLARIKSAPTNVTTKSHSRSLIGAAAGQAADLRLGVDIEWTREARPFAGILRTLYPALDCNEVASEPFYRAWTYMEAHFKAFQEFPEPDEVASMIAGDAFAGVKRIGSNGVWLLQHRVHQDFQLSLVWKSSELCAVEYLSCSGDD